MLPPTEYWLTVGLGKPGMPKAARLMRVRSAEALNDPVGVLVSAWAAARACSRVASAAARVGLSDRAWRTVRSRSAEPSAVHQAPALSALWPKELWPRAGAAEAVSPAMA